MRGVRQIVEADHRHVVGHPQPQPPHAHDHRLGVEVARGDDRLRHPRTGLPRHRDRSTGVPYLRWLGYERLVERQPPRRQPFQVAAVPQLGAGVRHRTAHEGDPLVPVDIHEMLNNLEDPAGVVEEHARMSRQRVLDAHQGHRQPVAERFHGLRPRVRAERGSPDHQPVQPGAANQLVDRVRRPAEVGGITEFAADERDEVGAERACRVGHAEPFELEQPGQRHVQRPDARPSCRISLDHGDTIGREPAPLYFPAEPPQSPGCPHPPTVR